MDAYAAPTIVLIFNTVFSVMFIILFSFVRVIFFEISNEEVRDDFCFFLLYA